MSEDDGMANVVWVGAGDSPSIAALAPAMDGGACPTLHRVHWREAYLARDTHRLVCRFRAPDAESVRLALHCTASDGVVWTATVVGRSGSTANLVLEREFAKPLRGDPCRALALARAECLEACGVEPMHIMISLDRRHALFFCNAQEGMAARLASIQRLGGRWRCWPCSHVAAPA